MSGIKKIGRFDGFRTTAFFGFDMPNDPNHSHYHLASPDFRYVPLRRSKSLEEMFNSEKSFDREAKYSREVEKIKRRLNLEGERPKHNILGETSGLSRCKTSFVSIGTQSTEEQRPIMVHEQEIQTTSEGVPHVIIDPAFIIQMTIDRIAAISALGQSNLTNESNASTLQNLPPDHQKILNLIDQKLVEFHSKKDISFATRLPSCDPSYSPALFDQQRISEYYKLNNWESIPYIPFEDEEGKKTFLMEVGNASNKESFLTAENSSSSTENVATNEVLAVEKVASTSELEEDVNIDNPNLNHSRKGPGPLLELLSMLIAGEPDEPTTNLRQILGDQSLTLDLHTEPVNEDQAKESRIEECESSVHDFKNGLSVNPTYEETAELYEECDEAYQTFTQTMPAQNVETVLVKKSSVESLQEQEDQPTEGLLEQHDLTDADVQYVEQVIVEDSSVELIEAPEDQLIDQLMSWLKKTEPSADVNEFEDGLPIKLMVQTDLGQNSEIGKAGDTISSSAPGEEPSMDSATETFPVQENQPTDEELQKNEPTIANVIMHDILMNAMAAEASQFYENCDEDFTLKLSQAPEKHSKATFSQEYEPSIHLMSGLPIMQVAEDDSEFFTMCDEVGHIMSSSTPNKTEDVQDSAVKAQEKNFLENNEPSVDVAECDKAENILSTFKPNKIENEELAIDSDAEPYHEAVDQPSLKEGNGASNVENQENLHDNENQEKVQPNLNSDKRRRIKVKVSLQHLKGDEEKAEAEGAVKQTCVNKSAIPTLKNKRVKSRMAAKSKERRN